MYSMSAAVVEYVKGVVITHDPFLSSALGPTHGTLGRQLILPWKLQPASISLAVVLYGGAFRCYEDGLSPTEEEPLVQITLCAGL